LEYTVPFKSIIYLKSCSEELTSVWGWRCPVDCWAAGFPNWWSTSVWAKYRNF